MKRTITLMVGSACSLRTLIYGIQLHMWPLILIGILLLIVLFLLGTEETLDP